MSMRKYCRTEKYASEILLYSKVLSGKAERELNLLLRSKRVLKMESRFAL